VYALSGYCSFDGRRVSTWTGKREVANAKRLSLAWSSCCEKPYLFSLFPPQWETSCGQFTRVLRKCIEVKGQWIGMIFWDLVKILVGDLRLGFEVDLQNGFKEKVLSESHTLSLQWHIYIETKSLGSLSNDKITKFFSLIWFTHEMSCHIKNYVISYQCAVCSFV